MMRVLFGLCLALSMAIPGICRAESTGLSPEQVARAEQLFHEGTKAFEAAQYPRAYESLHAAWQLAPSYRTAAGLGQVELQLEQYRDAAFHLSYCLRHYPADGEPTVRTQIEDGLEQARTHVAAIRVRVSVEGADVTVDGASAGKSPLDGLVFVDPGSHVVAASQTGYRPATETVETPVRATRDVALSLLPDTSEPSTSAAPLSASTLPESPPEPERRRRVLSPTAWVLIVGGSLTAAALATSVVFDLKGSAAGDDLKAAQGGIRGTQSCRPGDSTVDPATCQHIHDLADTRNTDNQIAILGAIVTGALAVATVGTAIYVNSKDRPIAATSRPYVRFSAGLSGGGLVVGSAF
jgi:hypothetical protein